MDATTLRLILIVVGVLLIVALYLWERQRARGDEDVDELDEPVVWAERQEPNFDPWDSPTTEGLVGNERDYARGASAGPEPPSAYGERWRIPEDAQPAEPEAEPDPNQPLIVQLSVIATESERFDGAAIVRAASSCGLEPGEMDVFHCYLGDENEQHTLFRVANLVKPGTFPFGAMEGFGTPGLVLFASIEGESSDLAVLDELVATARCLAEELKGEIRDETRNPFTAAKEETLRARVLARQMARDRDSDADAEADEL